VQKSPNYNVPPSEAGQETPIIRSKRPTRPSKSATDTRQKPVQEEIETKASKTVNDPKIDVREFTPLRYNVENQTPKKQKQSTDKSTKSIRTKQHQKQNVIHTKQTKRKKSK